jgi:hypothetical protein
VDTFLWRMFIAKYGALLTREPATPVRVSQQTVVLGLKPACNCWTLEGAVIFYADRPTPSFNFSFSITGFGAGSSAF